MLIAIEDEVVVQARFKILALIIFAWTSIGVAACSRHGGASAVPTLAQNVGNGTRNAKSLTDAYATAVLQSGPVAYYRLDDAGTIAVDSSGNGYSMTIGSAVTEGSAGLIASSTDTAITLPGTPKSAAAVITSSGRVPALEPANTLTVEVWIKPVSLPANAEQVIVAYGDDDAWAPYNLMLNGAKKIAWSLDIGGGKTLTSNATLSVGARYHVVGTYDGSNLRLYVNGALDSSLAATGNIGNYAYRSCGLTVGEDCALQDNSYGGVTDEVAVYAKALSASDVTAHYNAATTGQAPSPTPSPSATSTPPPSNAYSSAVLSSQPVAYYRLADTGSTATDSSPDNLNGAVGASVTKGLPGLVTSSSDTAMGFPGTQSASGTVVVPPNSLFRPATTVSLEAWLTFSSAPKLYTALLGYGTDANYAPYDLFFRTGNVLVAQFYLSSGVLEIPAPAALQPNTPYYVVSTYDGTTGRLYLNGTLVNSIAKSGTLADYDTTHGFAIGDDAGLSDPAFAGTIAEVAVYAHTLAATDVTNHYAAATSGGVSPTPTPTATGTSGYVDWSTYGFDGARSGNNPSEQTLGAGNVAGLHLIWSQTFNGVMTGQPVLASGVNVSGTTHNVLYVGTRSGLFLALDADTGITLWQKQLNSSSYSCGTPQQSGVDRAVTFERSTNRVYVEDGQAQVHALDMSAGNENSGWPVQIPNSVAGMDLPHGALNYNPANHLLYATSSSSCDISPWHGRVVAINTQGPSIAGTFYTVPGGSGGGVWGQGGAALDPSTGNIFIAIGNADTTYNNQPQTAGYGEQVVELTPTLGLIAANYPPGITGGNDLDFGATPTLFQTAGGSQCAAAVNKSGLLAIYDRTNLAGGPAEDLLMNPPTDDADFIGLPAYSPATNMLYVQLPNEYTGSGNSYHHGLAALQLQTGCTVNPTAAWNATFGVLPSQVSVDDPHSPPTIANGVVYVTDGPNKVVYALNAQSGQILWTSGSTIANGGVYAAPMVDKNLYAVSYGGSIYAFGLGASGQTTQSVRRAPTSDAFGLNHRRF